MNSSKKLFYIANLRLPTEKAYGIQIAKTCEALSDLGVDLTLIVPFRISEIKEVFFDYYSINRNFKFKKLFAPDFYLPGKLNMFAFWFKNFMSAIILSVYAIVGKPDIIYSRDELPLFILSFFKKNLIYEAHRFSSSRKLFYRRFKNRNLKIVVITKYLKEDFIKIGFKPENILVAPDGVDLAEFDIDISKEEARNRVGLLLDKKIIMYTGHLFEWKGADVLLESARRFQVSGFRFQDDVLFVFIGGTNYDIKKFKEKSVNLDNVLILGRKQHKEIPLFLKAADILVLPNSAKEKISKFYTSPLKMFEYMASGRPIIASDIKSLREILNQHNSVLVKSDDAADLSDGLKMILENQTLAKQVAAKAFEDVQKYSWQERSKKIWTF